MSWDVRLIDPMTDEVCLARRHREGEAYCPGDVESAELSPTYNYAGHFDFDRLKDRRAVDTVHLLRAAVHRLGTERDRDSWAPTPGNAGHVCAVLLRWAEEHPLGVWEVT